MATTHLGNLPRLNLAAGVAMIDTARVSAAPILSPLVSGISSITYN